MSAIASERTAPTKSAVSTPASSLTRFLRSRSGMPVALGMLGFLVAFIGSWIPSYWGDEAASVMSAERSLPSLFRMLGNVDAVHGAYYVFLHYWIDVFGASELSTRFPSAVAAGFVVAGTYLLGVRLSRRSIGITAAVIAAFLPRLDYAGAETRSYAMSTAIALWLTLLFIEYVHRRTTSRWSWLLYGIGMAVGFYVFLYLGLLVLVHGAYLLSTRRFGPMRRRWLQATIVAGVLALPIAWWGYQERGQVAFLARRNYATFYDIVVVQWLGNPFIAVAVWALVILAVVAAVTTWRRRGERSELVVLSVLWVILPTAALLCLNFVTPTYNLRYVTQSAPALSLLAAAGIFSLHSRRVAPRILKIIALAAVVALALPTDIGQREQYAMNSGSDLAQSAALIGSEARAGDAIVFDRSTLPSQRPRLALHLYPSDFAGLKDVALKESYRSRAYLWDTTWPLDEVSQRLDGVNTVWLMELTDSTDNVDGTDIRTLKDLGYTLGSTQTVNRTIIYKFEAGD